MKKKILSLILAICLIATCMCTLSACKESEPPTTVYTVTEEVWKANLNLTRNKPQTQNLACVPAASEVQLFSSNTLTQITSYTVYAEGVNAGTPGTALLKMCPDGMYIEFKINGNLKESESGTFEKTNVLYESVKMNMMMFVPFAEYYDDFNFDETKNAYVAQNLTATIVDDYDIIQTETIYHKTAEVSFINGYLNTVSVEMCDSTFSAVFSTFTFTFSNINNTSIA